MKLTKTKIKDLYICEPRIFEDNRGYFFESYSQRVFKESGINIDFVQDNESKSSYGVVRGLHYQLAPYAQSKLVRVLSGKVLDVAVDLRKGSPTFGQWESIELTNDNKRSFLVPQGFAHGFSVLSKEAVFSYKCDNFYSPENERGIHPLDSTLNIDWKLPADKVLLSEKDRNQPLFKDAEHNFIFD